MDCNDGRSIQIITFKFIHLILSILVTKDSLNTESPKEMDCRLGRSNHYSFTYSKSCHFLPRTTKELLKKFGE